VEGSEVGLEIEGVVVEAAVGVEAEDEDVVAERRERRNGCQ
jgi:hypothetical protein